MIPTGRPSSGFTASPSRRRTSWMPTSSGSKRLRSGTTGSWAGSWACSCSRDEGPGFPLPAQGHDLEKHPAGLLAPGPQEVRLCGDLHPIILNRQLWERSGHWDHYKQNMYTTVIDEEDYAIKPMNCPGGMLVYASEPHSYREPPAGGRAGPGTPARAVRCAPRPVPGSAASPRTTPTSS